MQRKQEKQRSALERRRRDVEMYKEMLSKGHFTEELTEEVVKRKLNVAKEHVQTLEGRLAHVLAAELRTEEEVVN